MTINPASDALIVVDQQHDFQPGGALAVSEGDVIVPAIDTLASRFSEVVMTQDHHPRGHVSFASSYRDRAPFTAITLEEAERGEVILSDSAAFTLDDLLAYLRHSRGHMQALWPDHCVIGTRGEELDPRLDTARATLLIRKGYRAAADSYSGFRENDGATTGLAELLKARGISRVFVTGLAGDYCVYSTARDAAAAGLDAVYIEDLTRFVGVPENAREDAYQAMSGAGVKIIRSEELEPATMGASHMGGA
jgi:nicotinamidase/pyrazinamidase